MLTDSTDVLGAPDEAAALGLTRQQAEDIRRGALDMGLTQCSDPHNSPTVTRENCVRWPR